jgi:hypothetical protein
MMASMMRLRSITLLRDRVKDWSVYPFVVPVDPVPGEPGDSIEDLLFRR